MLSLIIRFFLQVFNPVLDRLRYCISMVTVADRPAAMLVENIYRLLSRLLNIKVDNVRPIADLVASRPDFVPTLRTELQGREIARLCFFGRHLYHMLDLDRDWHCFPVPG